MTRALIALVAIALAFPVAASAQSPKTNAPAGNSAIDEYLETVPGASGNASPRPPGTTGGGGLTPAQRAHLEQRGSDGKALADAIDATAADKTNKQAETSAAEGIGRSPLREVVGTVTGSDGGDGMGAALPAILIGALLAAVLLVLLRRRATS